MPREVHAHTQFSAPPQAPLRCTPLHMPAELRPLFIFWGDALAPLNLLSTTSGALPDTLPGTLVMYEPRRLLYVTLNNPFGTMSVPTLTLNFFASITCRGMGTRAVFLQRANVCRCGGPRCSGFGLPAYRVPGLRFRVPGHRAPDLC